jgi:cysteine/glycine-rich protein
MSGKFGGGGVKCTICGKTSYAGETISFEKKPYHVECFKCSTCSKKMEGAAKAAQYDGILYCHNCFNKGGFAQKQKKVVWTPKEPSANASAMASKFGGGGNPCTICSKTVYPAETLSFEKKVYHPQCFACSKCEKQMHVSGAAIFEGALFCTKCFADGGYRQKQAAVTKGTTTTGASSKFASRFGGGGTKCVRCAKTVYPAETVQFEKHAFHADCFTCLECSKKLAPGNASYKKDGETLMLYCKKCWQEGGHARAALNPTAAGTADAEE